MEFPIEIQMLINDYARPISRPDWRQGSFLTRHYKQNVRRIYNPPYEEFKEYIDHCRLSPRRIHRHDQERKKYKMWGEYYNL